MLSVQEIEELSRQIQQGNAPKELIPLLNAYLNAQQQQPEVMEEKENHYLWKLFEDSVKAVVSLDSRNKIVDVNDGFVALFKISRAEAHGRSIHAVLNTREDLQLSDEPVSDTPAGRYEEFHLHCLRNDGKTLYTRVERFPIADQNETYLIITDETERKRFEESLASDSVRGDIFIDIVHSLWHDFTNYEKTLDVLTNKISQHIGGACVIHLFMEGSDIIEHVAINHANPKAIALFQELLHTTHWHASSGLPNEVVLGGNAILVPTVTPENIVMLGNSDFGETIQHLGTRSLLMLPMYHNDSVIGSMTLLRTGTDQPYSNADKSLTQRLANIAAMAIVHNREMKSARSETIDKLRIVQNEHRHYSLLKAGVGIFDLLEHTEVSQMDYVKAVELLGKASSAESAFIALRIDQGEGYNIFAEWSDKNCSPVLPELYHDNIRILPCWEEPLGSDAIIFRLPENYILEEQALLDDSNLRSLTIIPILKNGELEGIIVLENCVFAESCLQKNSLFFKILAHRLSERISWQL